MCPWCEEMVGVIWLGAEKVCLACFLADMLDRVEGSGPQNFAEEDGFSPASTIKGESI